MESGAAGQRQFAEVDRPQEDTKKANVTTKKVEVDEEGKVEEAEGHQEVEVDRQGEAEEVEVEGVSEKIVPESLQEVQGGRAAQEVTGSVNGEEPAVHVERSERKEEVAVEGAGEKAPGGRGREGQEGQRGGGATCGYCVSIQSSASSEESMPRRCHVGRGEPGIGIRSIARH